MFFHSAIIYTPICRIINKIDREKLKLSKCIYSPFYYKYLYQTMLWVGYKKKTILADTIIFILLWIKCNIYFIQWLLFVLGQSVQCSTYGITNCAACDIPDVDCKVCSASSIMNPDYRSCTSTFYQDIFCLNASSIEYARNPLFLYNVHGSDYRL